MRKVLFVCTHNAGRSQMAEALFNAAAPRDVRAVSAGHQPAREIWPAVVEAMAEIGIDLSDRRPQKLLPEMQLHADWAVTLACGASCPFVASVVEDWDISDPADKSLDEVRRIRDQIDLRVRDLVEHQLDAIRADRSAHQRRLAELLPVLIERFPDRPEQEIRACADAALAGYADAPVRSFLLPLAQRKATACLAAGGTC